MSDFRAELSRLLGFEDEVLSEEACLETVRVLRRGLDAEMKARLALVEQLRKMAEENQKHEIRVPGVPIGWMG